MVKAFKPPLLSRQPPHQSATTSTTGGGGGARGGGGVRMLSKLTKGSTSTIDTDSTFSDIHSPALSQQERALLQDRGITSGGGGLEQQNKVVGEGKVLSDQHQAEERRRAARGQAKAILNAKGKGPPKDVEWVFKNTFKKSHYKGQQYEIMSAALSGADILVIAPTGMGKSLCFQVPAVAAQHGLTIVVSPLLSLMRDQIHALQELNIAAAMLSSKTSREEQQAILDDMESGHPRNRLLYITPERLSSPAFKKRLTILVKQKELQRLVIDEAHCISEWGHDFRPDYAKLGDFRSEFGNVPIMALTASATPKVQDDIVRELGLNTETMLKSIHPFNRMNLFYELRYFSESTMPSDHRRNDLLLFIQKIARGRRTTDDAGNPIRSASTKAAGIIYCRAKKTCDEVSAFLRENGILAAAYHRGLPDRVADANQRKWIHNDVDDGGKEAKVDCIVATIAFGMGIDKGNCAYVVHYDIPKSFEGYYQETGRAGRNGHAARCLLYYSVEDKARIQSLVEKSHGSRVRRNDRNGVNEPSQRAPDSIAALLAFAENVKMCRHVAICRYFGEQVDPSDAAKLCQKMCDVCKAPEKTKARRNDGLVTLDFAQTQAVVDRYEEEEGRGRGGGSAGEEEDEDERDPEHYYPDATMRKKPADQSEEEEEEKRDEEDDDDDDALPKKRKPEGFRTAAVEFGREKERKARSKEDTSSDESRSNQSDENEEEDDDVVIGDSIVRLRDQDNRDSPEEEVEIVARPSKKRRSISPPPPPPISSLPASSPPPSPSALTVAAALAEEEGEQEDDSIGALPFKQKKKARTSSPKASTSALPTFETPFLNPALRPSKNIKQTLKHSSIDDPISVKFTPDPEHYDKSILAQLRRDTIVHFEKWLARAFLSKHNHRSSNSEEKVWKELGAATADHVLRRKILLSTAIELESDLFWLSLTAQGYTQFQRPRFVAIKRLLIGDQPLPPEGNDVEVDEIIKALKRSAKRAVLGEKREKKRKKREEEEEQG